MAWAVLPWSERPQQEALGDGTRAGKELGLDLREGMAGGGSDGSTTSLFTATLDGLGAVGDGAHSTHEFVYTDRMVERCALLALLLMEPPYAGRRDP